MKIQFCGAAKTVTGSCYFFDTGKTKFLVDCGMFQGDYTLEKYNYEKFPFDPAQIDYVFLTHAHFDHCGRLPLLTNQGFKGKIICTQPTRDLTQVVLLDAAKLQEEEYKRWASRPKEYQREEDQYANKEPLYTEQEVMDTMGYFEVHNEESSVVLRDDLEFRMRGAGHILGSVIFEFWLKNEDGRARKIVMSGDLGQPGQRIVRDYDMIREADYVCVESTYGDRLHRSKDDTVLELLTILKNAQEQKGLVIMPIFALERAQEIIYELNLFYEKGLLKDLPVYLDSPMAIEATQIFKRYPDYYDEDAKRLLEKGDDPFKFKELNFVRDGAESQRLIDKYGIVIMAGSGMCTGGRVVNHLMNHVGKKNTHVVFVGYQVKGTLGRKLVDGEPKVRIRGREYDVRAQIHTLGGFSAHADERDLRFWLRGFGRSPRRIFVCHGEESVATAFAGNLREELQVDTYVPNMEEIVELE